MVYRSVLVALVFLCTACAPQGDLDNAKREISRLNAENGQLRMELAKRSAIPVKVGFRKAILGPGLVAVIETTVKTPLSALATVKSSKLGTTKTFELHLDPASAKELGHQEGAVFEEGDTILFENKDYTSLTFTVPLAK